MTSRTWRAIGAILLALALITGPATPAAADTTDSEIRIRIVGQTGTETVRVTVDGAVVGTKTAPKATGSFWGAPGGWAWHTFTVPALTSNATVRVEFTNNGTTADGEDRNLRLDWILIDGERTQAEAAGVRSKGVWSNGARCQVGEWGHEVLACSGWFEFTAPTIDPGQTTTTTTTQPTTTPTTNPLTTTTTAPTTTPPAADTATIKIQSVGNTGQETLRVLVDGDQAAAISPAKATSFWSGSPGWSTHTIETPIPRGDVRLEFTDGRTADGGDKNVRIDWIEIDGTRIEAEHATVTTKGGWGNGSRCSTGAFGIDNLVCNGWMNFPVPDDGGAPPTTVPTGPQDVATIGDSNTASGYWRLAFQKAATCDVEMVGHRPTYWDVMDFSGYDADTDAVSGAPMIRPHLFGNDVFSYAQATLRAGPDVAVVLGGTNDVLSTNVDTTSGQNRITDVTTATRGHILDALATTPGTRFVVVAVPPLINNRSASDALNQALADMVTGLASQGHAVTWINPLPISSDIHSDGVHLNTSGGNRYGSAIAEAVCQ